MGKGHPPGAGSFVNILIRELLDQALNGITGGGQNVVIERRVGPMIADRAIESRGEDRAGRTSINRLLIKPGEVEVCILIGERWSPALSGTRAAGQAITLLSTAATIIANGRRRIMLGGDRAWVPPGVTISIEPAERKAALEVVAWGEDIGRSAARGIIPTRHLTPKAIG